MRLEGTVRVRWRSGEAGFTLLELVVVLVILGLLATAGGRAVARALDQARFEETQRRLLALRAALVGDPEVRGPDGRADFGYAGDLGDLPVSLERLLARGDDPPWAIRTEPTGGIARPAGWHGPYVRPGFQEDPSGALRDGWGESIRLVRDARGVRLVSAGPDGQPGTEDDLTLALDQELRGTLTGLLLDGRARPRAGSVVLVVAQRGFPARREAQAEVNGRFVFPGVPVGRHPLAAAGQDGVVIREVIVHPGRVTQVTFEVAGGPVASGGTP